MMQLLSLWKYFLWIQSIRPCFWAGEKKLMWFLFMKNICIYLSIVNNYRPESLLPVASKIFVVICNNLLNDIEPESLLNINQSSFRANGSCTKRLISITHEYTARSVPAHRLRIEVYFRIYPKPFTRFGTRDFCQTWIFRNPWKTAQSSRIISF